MKNCHNMAFAQKAFLLMEKHRKKNSNSCLRRENFCKSFSIINQFSFSALIEHSRSNRMVCTNNIGAFGVRSEVLKYEYALQRQMDLGAKALYSR